MMKTERVGVPMRSRETPEEAWQHQAPASGPVSPAGFHRGRQAGGGAPTETCPTSGQPGSPSFLRVGHKLETSERKCSVLCGEKMSPDVTFDSTRARRTTLLL